VVESFQICNEIAQTKRKWNRPDGISDDSEQKHFYLEKGVIYMVGKVIKAILIVLIILGIVYVVYRYLTKDTTFDEFEDDYDFDEILQETVFDKIISKVKGVVA
jgi:hypothetical protein